MSRKSNNSILIIDVVSAEVTQSRRCRQLAVTKSKRALQDELPARRLSIALGLPVSPSDGLAVKPCLYFVRL